MSMDREHIYQKVTELMVQLFDLDRALLKPEASIQELGLTSIDAIDLAVELQTMTGRKVNEAGLREIRTIEDIVRLVQQHLEQAEKASA
ncbi:MAG TPA: acyl carrier protein [Anaeromyxobacter sp.]|nr:acyl carrier protein [Anaeromyxobacter sp.]